MEMFLNNYLYFNRIDTYCMIKYVIKYIFTLKAVLIKAFYNETFLGKGKSEILKYFWGAYPNGGTRRGGRGGPGPPCTPLKIVVLSSIFFIVA